MESLQDGKFARSKVYKIVSLQVLHGGENRLSLLVSLTFEVSQGRQESRWKLKKQSLGKNI